MHTRTGWTMLAALALLSISPATGQVKVTRITYHDWPNAYRLANETVELVFVPQIGRVMRYGFIGGMNLIWENPDLRGKVTDFAKPPQDWLNYGGDKLWPAPQSVWGWPPDPILDSGPHKVEILSKGRLKVRGQFSQKHGIRFERIIELAETGTEVTFQNTLINESKRPLEWSVWQVTQVDDPDLTRMDQNLGGKFGKGYFVFEGADPEPGLLEVAANQVRLKRGRQKSAKIGGDAPSGRIVAEKGKLRLDMYAIYETGKTYPDGGCAQEIYTNPDPLPYIELELLSPITRLAPRARYTFATCWKLSRLP